MLPDDEDGRIDPAQVTGWLVCCGCSDGTPGPADGGPRPTVLARWQRVPAQVEDVEHGRVASDDPLEVADLDRADVAEAAHRLWEEHTAPQQARQAIRRAATEADGASVRLDQAVSRGRRAGLSWADVGRAVGITRQSARERWGKEEVTR